MSGKFQVDREIFENGIWNNVAEFRLFFYILGKAIWRESGVQMGNVLVGRGQYLRSYRNLREDLMYMDNNTIKYYGLTTIKRLVDKLVKDGRLEKKETELGTLFTVVNYSLYQGFNNVDKVDLEQQRNSNGTPAEQQRNNKKKGKKDKKGKKEYKDIVEYLNSKTNKSFKSTTKTTQGLIDARMNEGFDMNDFKIVIDKKSNQWRDGKMDSYLRPQTLFGTKFESYLNEGGNDNGKNKRNDKEDEYSGLGWSFEDMQQM